MSTPDQLERFHPVMLYSILAALRRFEPDFYAHVCRTQHVDADTILGLFATVEELGPGPLPAILQELRLHHAYHEIMHLAGRNAVVELAASYKLKIDTRRGGEPRFKALAKQFMPLLIGKPGFNMMSRGDLTFVEIRDSIFARDTLGPNPLCGFYTGALLELAQSCNPRACVCAEVRCRAMEPEIGSCMFQVGF